MRTKCLFSTRVCLWRIHQQLCILSCHFLLEKDVVVRLSASARPEIFELVFVILTFPYKTVANPLHNHHVSFAINVAVSLRALIIVRVRPSHAHGIQLRKFRDFLTVVRFLKSIGDAFCALQQLLGQSFEEFLSFFLCVHGASILDDLLLALLEPLLV